jgi:hypothetical protein
LFADNYFSYDDEISTLVSELTDRLLIFFRRMKSEKVSERAKFEIVDAPFFDLFMKNESLRLMKFTSANE